MSQNTKMDMEIFESDDIKEDESPLEEEKNDIEDISPDEIEEINIKPTLAFQRFAGKVFDPNQPITKNWKAQVYSGTSLSTSNNNNNNNSNSKFESPLQKYQRLYHEIVTFENELNNLIKNNKNDSSSPTKNITDKLNEQLRNLWSNVEEFKSNPKLSSLFDKTYSSQLETIDSDILLNKLKEFEINKNNNEEKENSDNNNNNNNNSATFTLYHTSSENIKSYKLNELASRVEKLENIIGPSPSERQIGNMTQSIEYLSKRMDLLSDTNKLKTLKRRAQTLKQALSDLKFDSQVTMEDQITKAKEQKINKMFEMMERWDQGCIALPKIINRLKSLKNLHESSVDLVQKVDNLQNQQKLIKESLKENEQILKQVNISLEKNSKTMLKNIQSIDERIKKLQESIH